MRNAPTTVVKFTTSAVVERALEMPRDQPVTIVFANAPYMAILANWLVHARAAGASNILVVALDRDILEFATGQQMTSILLPDVASRQELWLRRIEIFAALASNRIDFIHSDADAVWLRSPYESLLLDGVDMAFSQGTRLPPDVAKQWGFVLCCGLFAVRGGNATASFFMAVEDRMPVDADDQAAVNRVLRDRGIVWQTGGPAETKEWNGRPLNIFPQRRIGTTSNLAVALLPHCQFPRLPEISPDAIVSHPVISHLASNESIEARLRRLGLWRVA